MIAFLVIYVMISLSVASWAQSKGRDFWTVFFISIAISPLFIIVSLWHPFKAR
jgi:predicted membrane channel-forming protein YqfA (hemolysin III family)